MRVPNEIGKSTKAQKDLNAPNAPNASRNNHQFSWRKSSKKYTHRWIIKGCVSCRIKHHSHHIRMHNIANSTMLQNHRSSKKLIGWIWREFHNQYTMIIPKVVIFRSFDATHHTKHHNMWLSSYQDVELDNTTMVVKKILQYSYKTFHDKLQQGPDCNTHHVHNV